MDIEGPAETLERVKTSIPAALIEAAVTATPRPSHPPERARMSEVIGGLSYALDLTEGQPPGHSLRCVWVAMWIGDRLGLRADALSDLYYTVLLKDVGCSSNAARLWELYGGDERTTKHDYKTVDSQSLLQLGNFVLRHAGPGEALRSRIQRVLRSVRLGDELAAELIQTRCERGASIVRRLGLGENVALGVHSLDEHWNGRGRAEGLVGEAIPLASRIALLAQIVDVFHAVGGRDAAAREVRRRSGAWFDPAVVEAFLAAARDPAFWGGLADPEIEGHVAALEPSERVILVDQERLDTISLAFADVVDAKSSFTGGHSRRVTRYADAVAAELGFGPARRRWLRRAALLHDIGKLGVSNGVLEKLGPLTDEEYAAVRRHAALTEVILERVAVFRDLAAVAAAHHERMDGRGYPKGLIGEAVPFDARILAVADVYDALSAARPYRGPMPVADALALMARDRGTAFDPVCFDALTRRAGSFGEMDPIERSQA